MALSPWLFAHVKHDAPYAWFRCHHGLFSSQLTPQHIEEYEHKLAEYLQLVRLDTEGKADYLSAMEPDTWGAVFILTVVAIEQHNTERFTVILDDIAERDTQYNELVSALTWLPIGRSVKAIKQTLKHASAKVRACGIEALSILKQPPDEQSLLHWLTAGSDEERVAALQLIGDLKATTPAIAQQLGQLLTIEKANSTEVFYAIRAALRLGNKDFVKRLTPYLEQPNEHFNEAVIAAFSVLSKADIEQQFDQWFHTGLPLEQRLFALMVAGLPHRMTEVLEAINDPAYNQQAGMVFSVITGMHLDDASLSLDVASDFEPQAANSDYADLPMPDPILVPNWWRQHEQAFDPNNRYLGGQAHSPEGLIDLHQSARQYTRYLAGQFAAYQQPNFVADNLRARLIRVY
ncbi:hypothetical protein M3I01_008645 [Marinomonas sp. RSW2]|uniref:HEAT repeat protein n=1 Tax=Marinomonas maritima TaxID=2940935 RepID=A0ABT5WDU7_9GAMM|nr:hypothetical protein [Marinomonas maritima]MDE8602991.1 hypothetical protein [Marinomonas maritima]